MRCLAVALELVVASVDGPAVLVGRMPYLGPIPASALAALDFAGENRGVVSIRYITNLNPSKVPQSVYFFFHLVHIHDMHHQLRQDHIHLQFSQKELF